MNLIAEYIKYQWNAKGRHGTHSPFVFDFVDNCLKIDIDSQFINERSNLFSSLKFNNNIIEVTDFGAGSKRLSNKRKISGIFQTSSSKGKYGDLLFKLSKYYKPKRILEFGTSLGIGTIHLSKGNPEAELTTLEACNETREIALHNLEQLNCSNIESILSTFSDFLETYPGEPFDLVFIDGHHDGSALINYLDRLKKITHNDTIFVIDDIRWSDSMLHSWKKIIASDNFHLTMDLFRMGIVIPRKQQAKEHFLIRMS